MSTRAAIPEHAVVLDNPPLYPSCLLAALGVLLPAAYLSQVLGASFVLLYFCASKP
jgi:hypothetical protein